MFGEEFERFCAFIGIETPPIMLRNTSDRAQHRPRGYSRYAGRMSRKALDRINDLFARDFELFGYELL